MSVRSPAKSPSFSGESDDRIVSNADQDHPDAPLPVGEQQQGCEQQDHGEYTYRCTSDAEEQAPLADSEPRPIDDQDDAAMAASRPLRAWHASWLRNKGMALVLLAQMFGASMNVMTQILEIHSAMHPFQVSTSHRARTDRTVRNEAICRSLAYDLDHLLNHTNMSRSSSPVCLSPQ